MSMLVRMQRGSLDKLSGMISMGSPVHAMVLALRLAVLFARSRSDISQHLQPVLDFDPESAGLRLPAKWLDINPLTTAALNEESRIWKQAGYRMTVRPDETN